MALTDDIYKKFIPVATSKVVGPVVNGQRAHSLQKRAGQGRAGKGKNKQRMGSMGSACEPHEGGESQRGTPHVPSSLPCMPLFLRPRVT